MQRAAPDSTPAPEGTVSEPGAEQAQAPAQGGVASAAEQHNGAVGEDAPVTDAAEDAAQPAEQAAAHADAHTEDVRPADVTGAGADGEQPATVAVDDAEASTAEDTRADVPAGADHAGAEQPSKAEVAADAEPAAEAEPTVEAEPAGGAAEPSEAPAATPAPDGTAAETLANGPEEEQGPEPPEKDVRPRSVPSASEKAELSTQTESIGASRTSTTTTRSYQHSASSASSLSRGGGVFVTSALDAILSSREAKRSKELHDSATAASDMVRRAATPSESGGEAVLDPRVVFEPLRLACETKSLALQTTSLDCIAKLVSYAFFAEDPDTAAARGGGTGGTLADVVVETVCNCYEETVDERVAVQIVKALLACVLSTSIRVHQSSLLRAVRTVYNIFLMSRTPGNQAIAQGSLSQMVNYVFSRVPRKGGAEAKEDTSPEAEPVTLQMLENRRSFEGATEREDGTRITATPFDAPDLLVKDAFLILRALCKLSMKPLGSESERDVRSHAMRSKLLSLRMVREIMQNHLELFTDASVQIHSTTTGEQTTFVHAVKQYICISLSRNAVSPVIQVFELSCEIFWLVIAGMRAKMKKEIEVLFNEIFLPILEMKNSTPAQKSVLLGVVARLCRDPQALVEMYLNYDCDRSALENVYERLMNAISRIAQTPQSAARASASEAEAFGQRSRSGSALPETGAAHGENGEAGSNGGQPIEVRLKRQSLDCLCAVLHSLVTWMQRSEASAAAASAEGSSPRSSEELRRSPHPDRDAEREAAAAQASLPDDDPGRFENAKQRKTNLIEAIRKFNYKPKRGIEALVEQGFIRSREPRDIARFLFYADGLSKTHIGEFLGEGDPENIAIMHAFVDLMDFDRMPFTAALRRFLQAFRLPGEAQKIDRFMLKFAERYVDGNKDAFANADTAYVFAYSVIMLNTDAHNPQVKHRMSLQDFIKNNAGIDDGRNLPEEYLRSVYDEIQRHEIKMKDDALPAPLPQQGTGIANAIATVGRDLQREAYVLQSEGMMNRTEVLFRTMLQAQRRAGPQRRVRAEQYFSASHIEHVRPMFEVAWMSFLAGISTPLQDSLDPEVIHEALAGFRDAIKIVCFFGMELERNAFVTTLAKFTFLNNLGEMKSKNVETIKVLLGIAHSEGNYLRGSWREVLTCVSQLERFQLISSGVDERVLPELGRRRQSVRGRASSSGNGMLPTDEVLQAGGSSEIMVAADRVFSSTPSLSGEAIIDFVQALCDVSWEEIQSSGMSENPRLFSLQKVVEISYYNMERIRMEWSRLWAILGEHFNQVCCHPNAAVSAFGLDSLRQLAVKFLEKEELLHFKFQKDFLRPFEHTMRRSRDVNAKEMVLQCLEQMVQSRAENIRSGWRTMLGVFGAAAAQPSERVAVYAFDLVRGIQAAHFSAILMNGSFADLCVCIASFGKSASQKISLQATEQLRDLVPLMLEATECPIDPQADPGPAAAEPPADDPMVRFWFPVLFALYDIIMTGDDLEVRRVALDSLFAILRQHGSTFRPDFWDTVCQDVLFPIFNVLRNRSDVTRFHSQEDMSVWLSTTLIQALRNLVVLWTHYFDTLERKFSGLLELLCACICQENDTLARIGTASLQQLIIRNESRFAPRHWQLTVDAFLRLFRATTASQVFDPALSAIEGESSTTPASPAERRQAFKQIIVKCVLQLLLIETTHELLQNSAVYDAMPVEQLLRITQALEESYRFSRRFNADRPLRIALWKVGFMKQLPNLLKQESTSAGTLVHVYLHMQRDARVSGEGREVQVADRFAPLAEEIISGFLPLDNETQARNISAWTPVVSQVLLGLAALYDTPAMQDAEARARFTRTFYPLAVELLEKVSIAPQLARSLRRYLTAVGTAHGHVDLAAEAERARAQEEARQREDAQPTPPRTARAPGVYEGEEANQSQVFRESVVVAAPPPGSGEAATQAPSA